MIVIMANPFIQIINIYRSGKGRTGSAPVYPIRYIPLISYCHYYKYHYLTSEAITLEISPSTLAFSNAFIYSFLRSTGTTVQL